MLNTTNISKNVICRFSNWQRKTDEKERISIFIISKIG